MLRKRSRRERAGAKEVERAADGADASAGWEFLISSGDIEDLSEEALLPYFATHGLQSPQGKLAMLQAIRAHPAEVAA